MERFHGAWAHWYDGDTGEPFSFSKYDDGGDLVETALLMQGLLTARQWTDDQELKELCDKLWKGVEWDWYTRGTDTLYWHWSKNHEWKMNHAIRGFDETLITYVLAASSPTHTISRHCYEASYKTSDYYYNGREYYGIPLSIGMEKYGGPLFFTHYSFLGLDPRNLSDSYASYWDQNVAHAKINHAYCVDNPNGYIGYSADCWGLTASDYPGGYIASSPTKDKGTIAPTAAIASMPYTPTESMAAMKYFYYVLGDKLFGEYGFHDSFSLQDRWFAKSYIAIDQGPIVVMIENHRSGIIWDSFMKDPDVRVGLTKLGFTYNKNQ
ncbi:MAG: glucoamylase family protein [Candidatus Cryptobacteroides sp.]